MSFLPNVSVIVPALNASATLRACLDSLCALEYPQAQLQLLIVDNGSHDDTRAIIQTYAPRVEYLVEPKRGRAAARNRGILHVRSEYIAFTDADCVVEHAWLGALVEPLRDETVGIVGGAIRAMYPCNAIEQFGERIHDHEKAICEYKPPYVATSNWASPRAVLIETGLFDETLVRGSDTDLAWRIVQHGERVVYQSNAVIYHRNTNTLRRLFREGFQHGYHSVFVYRKHRAFLETFGYRPFSMHRYKRLFTAGRAFLRTGNIENLCDFTFNSGKNLGKLCGSLWTGNVEL